MVNIFHQRAFERVFFKATEKEIFSVDGVMVVVNISRSTNQSNKPESLMSDQNVHKNIEREDSKIRTNL